MNRADLIDYLVEHRLNQKRGVKNPTRIRQFIRDDLEAETDDELQNEYDTATGARQPGGGIGVDYKTTTLDHAISDALVIITRGFDLETEKLLLEDNYNPAIAGRALAMAIDGAYKLDLGRTVTRQADRAQWNPISLAEYQAITGDPLTASFAEPDEAIDA